MLKTKFCGIEFRLFLVFLGGAKQLLSFFFLSLIPKDPLSFSTFSAPLLLSLHLTLVRCGERKGGPEKEENRCEIDPALLLFIKKKKNLEILLLFYKK